MLALILKEITLIILMLLELQLEGKKRMDAASFINGRQISVGTVLGK